LYWAEALAAQEKDAALKKIFVTVAKDLSEKESTIMGELSNAQGSPLDIGGYYHPDEEKTEYAMRPSATLNDILERIKA